VEAPLPGFSLGNLAYFHNPHKTNNSPMAWWGELLAQESDQWRAAVRTKWLEFLLRATPLEQIGGLAWAVSGRDADDTLAMLRAVFNDIALSPYTDFVDKTLAFLRHLVERHFLTATQHVDFLTHLLHRQARHLTAYDLVTFH